MTDEADGLAAVERFRESASRLRAEIAKVVVGQDTVVEELLLAVLARGHCLVQGVPGLAKTLLVQTLARTLGLSFSRIQFTPDLMPSDVTGTEVLVEDRASGRREFRFLPGPVFAHVVLADEINRTPPRTQAALLEAMQEGQVTVGGRRYPLEPPFFVLATQNPIEQEGTYPLPEAQLDRFMFQVLIDYPPEDDELEVIRRTTAEGPAAVEPVLSGEELRALQGLVRQMPAAEHVLRYALRLVRLSRPGTPGAPADVRDYLRWGAGPRAGQFLVLAAKARALLHGEACAATEDVRAVAAPVLRHRLITNFRAAADGVSPEELVRRLIAACPP
jgi:MoxR-like ATPase